jgi:hypothetical protein
MRSLKTEARINEIPIIGLLIIKEQEKTIISKKGTPKNKW